MLSPWNVTPKGVLLLTKCNASATRKGLRVKVQIDTDSSSIKSMSQRTTIQTWSRLETSINTAATKLLSK